LKEGHPLPLSSENHSTTQRGGEHPIGALAHLGLGRAYAMAGDNAKARAAYQDFLALWKDADPTSRPEAGQNRIRKAEVVRYTRRLECGRAARYEAVSA